MKQTKIAFVFWIFLSQIVTAQSNTSLNSSEIIQSLKKLNTLGSVLYIAAHPDDENTRLLTYLSKERNLRTGYLSITRGDGGQNLIGKEQGDLLGLIRTNELLAARKIDGAEQFFTRANDFGYSKNPEETLKFWNKDSVLADVVWCIRRFKPDVIICRFPPTGEGGHGHHTASALLTLEAVDAASDRKRFSEQLAFTEAWDVRRVFWNTFNFGNTNTTSDNQLKIDVGLYNPLLGKGYGEMAAESRSMHKSQGFGAAKGRGSSLEYFKQLQGDSATKDLFEGIDQTWNRIYSPFKFHSVVNFCIEKFNPQHPEKILSELVTLCNQLQKVSDTGPGIRYWKKQKIKEVEELIVACSSLWLEAGSPDYIGIPGNRIDITAQAIVRNNALVKLDKISWLGQTDTLTELALKHNELYSFKHKEILSPTIPYSNPYWLNEPHATGIFVVKDKQLIGQPDNSSSASVIFDIEIAGLPLKIERRLTYKHTDPVKGETYRPFEILPPATITFSEKMYVFSGSAKNIQLTVKANTSNVNGTLDLTAAKGWSITLKNPEFKLKNKGDETIIDATISPSKNNQILSQGKLLASLRINGSTFSKSITRIEYDHIPYQFILSDAEAGLMSVDLKKTGTNIGYIPGAGDDVADCLKQIGYNVTLLTDELLAKEDLSKYTAVVTGIRAYNTNDRLQLHHTRLMEYVEKGGNLIVQYNTNSRVGPLLTKIGPYPFTISRDRVTDENAEVRIINEKHSALNFPNKISSADFEGWKQERGIYFATELDKNYEAILSMNDPGEKPLEGSLIITKHGKGNFVYTGLAFFRELPAGVPGAYRLIANLISLSQNK